MIQIILFLLSNNCNIPNIVNLVFSSLVNIFPIIFKNYIPVFIFNSTPCSLLRPFTFIVIIIYVLIISMLLQSLLLSFSLIIIDTVFVISSAVLSSAFYHLITISIQEFFVSRSSIFSIDPSSIVFNCLSIMICYLTHLLSISHSLFAFTFIISPFVISLFLKSISYFLLFLFQLLFSAPLISLFL